MTSGRGDTPFPGLRATPSAPRTPIRSNRTIYVLQNRTNLLAPDRTTRPQQRIGWRDISLPPWSPWWRALQHDFQAVADGKFGSVTVLGHREQRGRFGAFATQPATKGLPSDIGSLTMAQPNDVDKRALS